MENILDCPIFEQVPSFYKVEKEVSASEFLYYVRDKPHLIKKARFVPPKIGSKGFGFFTIQLNAKP